MALYFYVQVPDTFGTHGTFSSIFGSQQVLVFLAMSALVTLVVGEFDLSVASVMGLTATTIPVLAGVHGMNIWLACLVGVGVAVLAGAVNAFFVVVMDVSSFVVTLGTGTLLAGIAQFISGTNIVSVNSPGLADFAIKDVLGMPISFYYGSRWPWCWPTCWPGPRSAAAWSSSAPTARSRDWPASASSGSASGRTSPAACSRAWPD